MKAKLLMETNAHKKRHIVFVNNHFIVGFTLVELIVVIVILSVLATMSTGFVVKTMESYRQTQARALLLNTARQALEQMTRQLRLALPYSIRLTNGDSCLEFMPVVAGGNYFSPVPDIENGAAGVASIPASSVTVDRGNARFLTIGAMASTEIYGGSPTSLANYSAYSSNALQISVAKQWLRNSINRRYFVLDQPQAFCVVSGDLRFYQNLNVASGSISTSGVGADPSDIVARNITAATPFVLATGTENRNTRITINLTFSSGGESINYSQGVLIRNVP